MRVRVVLAVLGAGIGMVLAHAPQVQPRRLGPAEIYPDPVRTPGAANPQVTQRNIRETICSRRWSTRLVRPPAQYTSRLKRRQLREYGDTVHQPRAELINPSTGKVDTTRCVAHSDNMACYEEDHLIPLEDGGDPTDPRNLWSEPYNTVVGGTIMGASQKDVVEGFIHDEICYGIPGSKKNSYIPATVSVTLRRDQEILAGDWYRCYESIRKGSRASEAVAPSHPAACPRAATALELSHHFLLYGHERRSTDGKPTFHSQSILCAQHT